MQLKNSMLLFTAMTAGSAVARLHGHERRHAHHEKRAVGDMVYATMGGKLVSWVNQWSGHQATTTAEQAQPTVAQTTTTSAPNDSPAEPTESATSSSSSEPASSTLGSGSCSSWINSKDSDFSRDGFGEFTLANMLEYVAYKGNVGSPWGSNIIEVPSSRACEYKHVVRFDGSEHSDWTIVFWNKIGPDNKLTGWYNGNAALTLTLKPGETKYVAFDDDSQGAWGAAKGDKLPTDMAGGYSCTWGEFDFGNSGNSGWSGWDVSAIQAQNANQEVQGMEICNHDGSGCSSVSNKAMKIVNAYSNKQEGVDGIGGNQKSGPARLKVRIDFD